MKSKLDLYYDEKGDFLEIAIGSSRNGHFQNLGNGVFKRVDKKTFDSVKIPKQNKYIKHDFEKDICKEIISK